MTLQPVHTDLAAYLQPCAVIDFLHPAVQAQAMALFERCDTPQALAQASYEFVRDQIAHSGDVRKGPVTLKASEVLLSGVGYCYAKSHLLAALLRANSLPAGLCYQRLSVGDAGAPYCLHGLNAVHLPQIGWYRLDARGNKPGVSAAFTPPAERLAFPIREPAEQDFPQIFATPLHIVVARLSHHTDIHALHADLPDLDELPWPSPADTTHPDFSF